MLGMYHSNPIAQTYSFIRLTTYCMTGYQLSSRHIICYQFQRIRLDDLEEPAGPFTVELILMSYNNILHLISIYSYRALHGVKKPSKS